MKNLLPILFVFACAGARGQDTTRNIVQQKRNMLAIKTNLIFFIPTLTIEKGFKRRHSVQLTGSYLYIPTLKEATSEYHINILEEYRYFLFLSRKNNFRGFYVGSGAVQVYDNYSSY